MSKMLKCMLSVVLVSMCMSVFAGEDIWVEGEDAASSTMKPHNWYSGAVKKGELSGDDFLSNFAAGANAEATFKFNAVESGSYTFWARMNPVANPKASYDLSGTGWKNIDFSTEKDKRNIATDGKPDMRFIAWVKIGKVDLQQGSNTLKFKFSSDNNNFGSLDCFYLTQTPFSPSGKKRPGSGASEADEGMWAFEPEFDAFSDKSMLDLTYLNTPIKNSDPFISIDKNGDFVNGTKPIRFWSLNAYAQGKIDLEGLTRHGHWLAKRGINMVRWHGHVATDTIKEDTKLEDVNKQALDDSFKLVAAMKANGIYTCLSPYWGSHTDNKPSWGLDHIDNKNLSAVVFWDPKVQNAYKGWLKELYTTKNPYTGIALKDDPAVAIIQFQNEDSMLFYTMQTVKGQVREDLKKLFGKFVEKKYGSLDAAYKAWNGKNLPADDVTSGKLDLVLVWELTQQRNDPGFEQRKSDQLEFYTKLMYDFNKNMSDYLRNELGCKQIINAGNWRTADDVTMLDSERYSYDANEVIGCNKYKSTTHDGPKSGYLIMPGDTYANSSVLLNPSALPVALKQVKGKAMIVPESTWVPPEKYQSEGALLTAAYSSLNGVDSLFWFAHGKEEWDSTFGKWSVGNPMLLGQFPAAALMFRQGYVERGKPVVIEHRTFDSMWKRENPLISESQSYDPNRDDMDNSGANDNTLVTPLAFLVGPVEVVYGGNQTDNFVADLAKYINSSAQTVESVTGQLKLNYGKGVFTLNAPKAQGASGWLAKEGLIKLSDVMIKSDNEYSTITVVSMDGAPINSSKKILVQVGTYCRPYEFSETPTTIQRKGKPSIKGFKIISTGQSIWNVEKTKAMISINNAYVSKAYALDANGMAVKELEVRNSGDKVIITLPEDALYIVLK
jgi:hypothetical protein